MPAGLPDSRYRSLDRVRDTAAGRRAIADHHIGPFDSVIGVAASGSTPFVRGALEEATARGALTASIAKRRDFVSYLGYGPSESEACENAKYHLQHMLQGDQCTPTKCECKKAARGAPQDGVDSARRSNASGERLPE